jgi:hypothetical protein
LLLAYQVIEPFPEALKEAVCPQKIETALAAGAAGVPGTFTVMDAQPLLN